MNKKIILAAVLIAAVASAAFLTYDSEDKETLNVGASVKMNGWTWSYDDNGDVTNLYGTGTTIAASDWPSAVTSMRYTHIGSINCPNLTTLTIPSHVKIIGSNAFEYCPISTLTITDGVEEIHTRAFAGINIAKVTIPASVTHVAPGAFSSCPNLTTFSVSTSNTEYQVKGGLLYTKGDMSLVCCGGGKSGIVSVNSGAVSMEPYAFFGCSKVTQIGLPSSITIIPAYTFQDCTSLRTVAIPEEVTSIGSQAFYNCPSLEDIELPWYLETIESYCFYGCSSLDVYIPISVKRIESGAFQNCAALQPIMFSKNVTSIGSKAFAGCTSLDYVVVADNTAVASDAFPEKTQILPYIQYTSYPTADMVVRQVSSKVYELSTSTEGKAVWVIGSKTLEGSTIQYEFASGGDYKILLNIYDNNGNKTHVTERTISVSVEDTEDSQLKLSLLLSIAAGITAVISALLCYFVPSSRRVLIIILIMSIAAAVILAAEAML